MFIFLLLSNFQNDLLTENTYNVEIKVDPPADGNAADTVSGNDAVQEVMLQIQYEVLRSVRM